jgi:hypothetical protein
MDFSGGGHSAPTRRQAIPPTLIQREIVMTVCKEINKFSRSHERIADFFSLLAVALLFASVWATLQFHPVVIEWLQQNALLHSLILVATLVAVVFLILGLLAIGSARFGDDSERCFRTFRGRRRGGSPLAVFNIWLNHMENVGKKHR